MLSCFPDPRDSSENRFAWRTLLRPVEEVSHHVFWVFGVN